MESTNNQIIYGRRGTGKTHALRYFQSKKLEKDDIAIYIDAQNIGSNGSIYNDNSLPISERATRLLVDVCSAIHHELLEIFTDPKTDWDLSKVIPALDEFSYGFNETRINGQTSRDEEKKTSQGNEKRSEERLSLLNPNLTIGQAARSSSSTEQSKKTSATGSEESWIDFNFFSRKIRELASHVSPKRIWFLIDEWTTIPQEIQPHLADMIRRAMFSTPNISVKIAAIEHRSNFKVDLDNEGYIGFEMGADVTANINLDDYLVVDNNEERAKEYFKTFIVKHAKAVSEEINISLPHGESLIKSAFTQENVFVEFVRATEGVPRDAMHILSSCAQKSNEHQISMPVLRDASHSFFLTEKYSAIQSNPENRIMLDWIRDEVIGTRQTRAFLLPVGEEDPIIDRLFDRRALHILNRSRSAAHRPGERFIVYKLDYGLYVDLVNTDKQPQGLLLPEELGADIDFNVPSDDARSYRRAILDLSRFYRAHPELKKGSIN